MAMGWDRGAWNVLEKWDLSHFQDLADSNRSVTGLQGVRLGLVVTGGGLRGVEVDEGDLEQSSTKKDGRG